MAEKKKAATAEPVEAVEKTAETPAPKKAEQAYALDSLARNCIKLFGVGSTTFTGAAAALDPDKKYTINEMKKIINDWSKKGAK